MRRPMIAGNWKMNKTIEESRRLVTELVIGMKNIRQVDQVLCPPFTDLWAVKEIIAGTDIGLGAQNMHWEASGAFTGEISPVMVSEVCKYVILGHSERRQYFGETDEKVNKKIKAALTYDLTPIVCIGETLQENKAGKTADVVKRQVQHGLAGLRPEEGSRLIIAYEPIWAIGTGLAATPEHANDIHKAVVREVLTEMFGQNTAQSIRILYGGSVKPENAVDFFSQTDIDGALVGGASLKAESFLKIIKAAVD